MPRRAPAPEAHRTNGNPGTSMNGDPATGFAAVLWWAADDSLVVRD